VACCTPNQQRTIEHSRNAGIFVIIAHLAGAIPVQFNRITIGSQVAGPENELPAGHRELVASVFGNCRRANGPN
jgi:hypothetical protein